VRNHHDPGWIDAVDARERRLEYPDVQRVLAREFATSDAVWLVSGPRDAVEAVYKSLGLSPTWIE
jgi:hypothetical protein